MGKLTADDVMEFVRLHREGLRACEISRRCGAPYPIVNKILNGHTWRHLTGIPERPPLSTEEREKRKLRGMERGKERLARALRRIERQQRQEEAAKRRQQRLEQMAREQCERDRELTPEEMAEVMPTEDEWSLPPNDVIVITGDNVGLLNVLPDQSQKELRFQGVQPDEKELKRVMKPDGVVIVDGKRRT